MALQIITRIGTLYNGLERKDQKELLRQVVSRVVVNDAGSISLELRTPFAYLRDLTDEIRTVKTQRRRGKTGKKNGRPESAVLPGACSSQLQSYWGGRIRTYECRIQSPEPCRLATPQSYKHYSRRVRRAKELIIHLGSGLERHCRRSRVHGSVRAVVARRNQSAALR